jgi:hypothetical protein
MAEYKHCSKCGENLPVSEFVRRKFDSGNWGYTSWCKPCRNEKSKADWEDGSIRDSIYKRKFGISLAEYDAMLEAQGGKCAICGTSELTGHGAKYGRFSVDHDHVTGEVRGLLCHPCNIGLGSFKDNVEVMKNAIFYLNRHADGTDNRPLLTAALQEAVSKIEALETRIAALEA